nr:MAG TPA: hypothetical protein [Caudoviricetes sp.]
MFLVHNKSIFQVNTLLVGLIPKVYTEYNNSVSAQYCRRYTFRLYYKFYS